MFRIDVKQAKKHRSETNFASDSLHLLRSENERRTLGRDDTALPGGTSDASSAAVTDGDGDQIDGVGENGIDVLGIAVAMGSAAVGALAVLVVAQSHRRQRQCLQMDVVTAVVAVG